MAFRSVPYDSLSLNPFTKIGKEWALLTAGDENGFNTMTVSWGAMGFMWGKPSVTVYIRPQRVCRYPRYFHALVLPRREKRRTLLPR